MRYRAEIDGLRALAVVPVILFHADFGLLPGGFAGVDVFFVISGFLITTILLEDLDNDRFSILRFYERRLRRIAPALLLVCLACLPFAMMWMLPSELDTFGKSLFHSLLMVANFDLWGNNYFDAGNELKPLLHMWSLAVEEQFYLFFPLLLWLMRRTARRTMFTVVAGIALVSFMATWPISEVDPIGNFYLPVTRVWELCLGALLAIYRPESIRLSEPARSGLAMLGLLLILLCYGMSISAAHYPGPATLLPCVGTVLIIAFASGQNLTGRLLMWRPLLGIGLISYSLYLWHQPIFAFARIRMIDPLSSNVYLLLIALTFVLAVLTYFLVEQPFRQKRLLPTRRLVGISGISSVLLIGSGIAIAAADGLPNRPDILKADRTPGFGIGRRCEGVVKPACVSKPEPQMVVWGDSFAMHIVDGVLASQGPDAPGLVQFNKSSCGPLATHAPALANQAEDWPLECLDYNAQVRDFIASTPSIRYVVLSTQLRNYIETPTLVNKEGVSVKSSYATARRDLENTLTWLRSIGIKPVVFAPPPRDGRDAWVCVARARLLGISNDFCAMQTADRVAFDGDVDRMMEDIAQTFPVVSLEDYLCDEKACRVLEQGQPFLRDNGHFSIQGSKRLGLRLDFYDRLVEAAERGCLTEAKQGEPPHGMCELKAVTGQATPAT
jgi:peptidoglycan/LPS O-acetylase OafA/YrhL/thiol-disulfide isomerase/thioredoxin